MEKIPSTMVLYKNVDEEENRFANTAGPLLNNTMEIWLG